MRFLICLSLPLLLWACNDSQESTDNPEPDQGLQMDQGADPDLSAPEQDFQVEPDQSLPDEGSSEDLLPQDIVIVDIVPPPILEAPLGRIYLSDPITDEEELSEVVLPASTDPIGRFTNESVQVFNCLNEEGGIVVEQPMGFPITISLCHEVQDSHADPDGHYLSIQPPEDEADANDPFSALMMYYHVTEVHDFFKERFGFTGRDESLYALVNVQAKVQPPISMMGFEPGPDGWYGLPNAAFFPAESWELLGEMLPPRPYDMILFGQDSVDFAYDARIIYHEYTHAVIGMERLSSPAQDNYGLDNSSMSMHEGLADYFAAALADAPEMGLYGIGNLAPDQVRDLSIPRRCPEDTIDEVHAHGLVWASTLWQLRQEIGPLSDELMFRALEQFGVDTGHEVAAQLLLAETALEEDPVLEETVRRVLAEHGLPGCERVLPYLNFSVELEQLPHVVEGRESAGLPGYEEGVPGYKQFVVELGEGALSLSWQISAGMAAMPIPGMGNDPGPLKVALRRGAPVEISPETLLADEILSPELIERRQHLLLDPECHEAGRWYLLFLNSGDAPVNIEVMEIEATEASCQP